MIDRNENRCPREYQRRRRQDDDRPGRLRNTVPDDDANQGSASGLGPGDLVGPYELLRLLGAGGMAEVWLARRADGAFKRDVALKLPLLTRRRSDLAQRFAHERDILASLEHPHIARFYDAGVDAEGLPYLSMEYVNGQALMKWCGRRGLGIEERLTLFLQILDAVKYAHEKHIIHRDLKPSNIFVTEAGQVRLLDFGVAKLLREDGDEPELSRIYGQALTPDYASPESLSGEPVDARSDVYSLGMVLYELLTGTRPYRLSSNASIAGLRQAVTTAEVKKPSTQLTSQESVARGANPDRLARKLRGDLDALVLKALAKEPSERYDSAASMAEDLQRYLRREPVKARLTPLTHRAGKFLRRNAATAGLIALAIVAVVAAVGVDRLVRPRSGADAAASFAPPMRSVAVLPFVDMSENKDQGYFSEGLAEELLDLLAKTPGLLVIARTSSFSFQGTSDDIPTIARKLNVANILEGSVRKSGNRMRITTRLVRASTAEQLWYESYDRELKDVFEVQDEIAGAVAAHLKLTLAPMSQDAARRTSNVEAYNQYLLGRQVFNRGNIDGYRLAIEAYSRAISLDPNYVAPYEGLTTAEFFVADQTGDAAGYRRAEEAAEKSVELGPEDASSYAARGFIRYAMKWDWAGAQADFEKAIALDPGDARFLQRYGEVLATEGRLAEAIATTRKAIELDPLSHSAWQTLTSYFEATRDFAAAHEAYRRALEISPQSDFSLNDLGTLQLLEGQAKEALATFRKIDNEGFRLSSVAMAEHSLGHTKESQQALEQLIAQHATEASFQIAEIYAWRGEKDQAFEWLEHAYRQRDGGLSDIKTDPPLAGLRSDPRYRALLRKMNLPE
jgi:serine/threonine protein kinase/TolB-like protein/Tfp pilus assembly protein PilF